MPSLGTASLPPQNTVITVHRHQGTCSKMTLCSMQDWLLVPDTGGFFTNRLLREGGGNGTVTGSLPDSLYWTQRLQ